MPIPSDLRHHVFRFGREAETRSDARVNLGFPYHMGERGVHEVVAVEYRDQASLPGFAFSAVDPDRCGALAWITTRQASHDCGRLSAAGLRNLRPKLSLLSVTVRKPEEALWATEETLRSGGASLVIAEVPDADFTATRRLSLAASRYGVPLVLLLPYTRQGATAAHARWRVRTGPSAPNQYDPRAPGQTRWQATLERCRIAPDAVGRQFNLERNDETLSLSLVPGLVTGSPPTFSPRPARQGTAPDQAGWQRTG